MIAPLRRMLGINTKKQEAVSMKKILVLEDESNIRSFVVINLRRSGYEPIEAENGAEALEKLKVNPDICLALLDVMLPDIDGFEVCRRIRATGSASSCSRPKARRSTRSPV